MRRFHPNQRREAAVLPLVTVCLIALMAFMALAIDIGMMALARTQAQSAADIAALAGARTLTGKSGNNKAGAEAEAREAAMSNSILSQQVTAPKIQAVNIGVYRYNTTSNRFSADFQTAPGVGEAYGASRVVISYKQPTFFARVLGINAMDITAMAVAVHRPRDISIVLDFSGSMKYSSEFNYPRGGAITGSLNPDPRFPRFGPWSIYPVATASSPNPMQRLTQYVDGGGETHAQNNMTMSTPNGPPIVDNFQITPGDRTPENNAFVYRGDLSGLLFDINNTPICTPTPADWTSQYASGYKGDRWPLKKASWSSTNPTATTYARTVGEMYNLSPVTTATRDALWEKDGYDNSDLTFKNTGGFKGYSMGPGYFGKSFYIWPPDPRYTDGADPTNINTTNPVQDASGKWMADWRKRFYLYPSLSSTIKGAPLDDNSKLFSTAGLWNDQNLGQTTLNYIPNYDAVLKWLKSGPQVLPASLRAGRVLYYSAIPDTIPMNWQTGVVLASATADQRFFKDYIDFVMGTSNTTSNTTAAGRFARARTLYGYGTSNSYSGSYGNSATGKITPKANLTGTTKPYMAYDDCPIHPRLHTWFGPLSMMGFMGGYVKNASNAQEDYNWFAGTTYEAQTWQLKAGIQSALDDIKNNHPNDLASLAFFSSHNGFSTARVPMSTRYDRMKTALFYPFSLIDNLSNANTEIRPYSTTTPASANSSGITIDNYSGNIPLADGSTNPAMGLMVSYNQFNWTGGYTGRNGAAKIVILETDGVANQTCNGNFTAVSGGNGAYQWTGVANGSNVGNGDYRALNAAISLSHLINQDKAGTKAWPSFPPYVGGTSAPANFYNKTAPGFSTVRQPAYVHTLAFGYLFEDSTTSNMKTLALEFLRNVQMAGGLAADPTTGNIEEYKRIVGPYDQRIDKLRDALQRIMQGGIQVALIE
jgi:Flp pilus assembly protein TadG